MSDSLWELIFEALAMSFVSYVIGRLAWMIISDWIESQRTSLSRYATVIQTHLHTGHYRVVGGIFDSRSCQTSKNVWDAEDLDDELRSRFDSSGRMTISF